MHPNARAYTRGTRRIDRIAIPREWLEGKAGTIGSKACGRERK